MRVIDLSPTAQAILRDLLVNIVRLQTELDAAQRRAMETTFMIDNLPSEWLDKGKLHVAATGTVSLELPDEDEIPF